MVLQRSRNSISVFYHLIFSDGDYLLDMEPKNQSISSERKTLNNIIDMMLVLLSYESIYTHFRAKQIIQLNK